MNRRLLRGLVLIALGILIALVNTGLLSTALFDFWPSIVFIIGLWLIYRGARRPGGRGITAGLITAATGAFFLAETLGFVDESLYLAVLLLSMGAGLVIRGLFFGKDDDSERNN